MRVRYFFYITGYVFISSRLGHAEELRDIKPPLYFPANYFLLFFILAVTALIIGGAIVYWFLRKRPVKKMPAEKEILKTAGQLAYEALAALRAKNLAGQGEIKQCYIELSHIIRHYMENRFKVRAPEMTTEEFLLALRGSDYLDGTQKNTLKEFLTHCDLIKFAKHLATAKEIDGSFAIATRLIDETKEEKQPQPEKTLPVTGR